MNIFDYIKDTKGEMKHVSWPTKKQTMTYTILIIVVSIAVAAYLGLFDEIFSNIINRLL
ncbi:preprotein translocase subunit SecE [Candidatus Parcubacteria bacterium]|nr:preprotein translocase subunit SecE [Candidatus Parcubacteria bacterium]